MKYDKRGDVTQRCAYCGQEIIVAATPVCRVLMLNAQPRMLWILGDPKTKTYCRMRAWEEHQAHEENKEVVMVGEESNK